VPGAADIVVQLAGLPSLQDLEQPAMLLNNLMTQLQADIDDATAAYQSRLARALKEISSGQGTLQPHKHACEQVAVSAATCDRCTLPRLAVAAVPAIQPKVAWLLSAYATAILLLLLFSQVTEPCVACLLQQMRVLNMLPSTTTDHARRQHA